jgi:DNA-binding transcriptional MerR regulator
MNKNTPTHTLSQLCALTDTTARTIRFYIQQSLVARPLGEKRGSHYNHVHLQQLLEINKWKAAGLSLERIRELLSVANDESLTPPPKPRASGSLEVWSHLHIQDGLELTINPERAGLSPEALRKFTQQVMQLAQQLQSTDKPDQERS